MRQLGQPFVPEFAAPAYAVCGFSGSGKTTLLEKAITQLVMRGLSVAVVKHDAHGFVVDKEGKDSDRLFKAGASVSLRGPAEQFSRRTAAAELSLEATLAEFAKDHDLLLVEGHKGTPLPKLWLADPQHPTPPPEVTSVDGILPWDSDRLTALLAHLDRWLPQAWARRPLLSGLLVGGKSSRMGRPKQLIEFEGRTLGERIASALSGPFVDDAQITALPTAYHPNVVVLGAGQIAASLRRQRRLTDVIGLEGPIAGLLAAHRWMPTATWILAACDHPRLQPADIRELVSHRTPGVWAVLPRQADGYPCCTMALYEPQALEVLERSLLVRGPERARMAELIDHPRTRVVPLQGRGTINVNTPEELRAEQVRG